MKIGVTSQNFRTITGHAGKTRKFLVYIADERGTLKEGERISLPKEMAMHSAPIDEPHPLDDLDILITAGCGQGFFRKMAARGVQVITTSEEDPIKAVASLLLGEGLPAAAPHHH